MSKFTTDEIWMGIVDDCSGSNGSINVGSARRRGAILLINEDLQRLRESVRETDANAALGEVVRAALARLIPHDEETYTITASDVRDWGEGMGNDDDGDFFYAIADALEKEVTDGRTSRS